MPPARAPLTPHFTSPCLQTNDQGSQPAQSATPAPVAQGHRPPRLSRPSDGATTTPLCSTSSTLLLAGAFLLGFLISGCGSPSETTEEPASTPTPEATPPATPAPIMFSSATLPIGQERVPYSVSLEASGGIQPLAFDVLSGTLPYGLRLDRATGLLAGTPSQQGTFAFTVRVKDAVDQVMTADFQVAVTPWNTAIPITCGESRSLTLGASAVNSAGVYEFQSTEAVAFLALTGIPGGTTLLTLTATSPDGDPALFLGRPGQSPGYEVVSYYYVSNHPGDEAWRLHPSTTPSVSAYPGYTTSLVLAATTPGTMTLQVDCRDGAVLTTPFLPNALPQVPYATSLQATAGTPPYSFEALETLPSGLTLSSEGLLSGSLQDPGRWSIPIQLTDAQGTGETVSLSLWSPEAQTLSCAGPLEAALSFETRAFNTMYGLATPEGSAFFRLELPPDLSGVNLTLESDTGDSLELFQGIPLLPPGSSDLQDYVDRLPLPVEAPEGLSLPVDFFTLPTLGEYQGELALAVAAVGDAGEGKLTLSCAQTPAVATWTLPAGQKGVPYEAALEAAGAGTGSWTTASALPDGLRLEDGVIRGNPTETGATDLQVSFQASAGQKASRGLYLAVGDPEDPAGCGLATPLTCDDIGRGTLTQSAWVDRVELDLTRDGGAAFFCLNLPEDVTAAQLSLANSSGDADLFVAYPGATPGDPDDAHYWYYASLDGDDSLTLDASSWPGLEAYHGRAGVAVAAYTPGQFLLLVDCVRSPG